MIKWFIFSPKWLSLKWFPVEWVQQNDTCCGDTLLWWHHTTAITHYSDIPLQWQWHPTTVTSYYSDSDIPLLSTVTSHHSNIPLQWHHITATSRDSDIPLQQHPTTSTNPKLALSLSCLIVLIIFVWGIVMFICVCSIAKTGCYIGPNGPNANLWIVCLFFLSCQVLWVYKSTLEVPY